MRVECVFACLLSDIVSRVLLRYNRLTAQFALQLPNARLLAIDLCLQARLPVDKGCFGVAGFTEFIFFAFGSLQNVILNLGGSNVLADQLLVA